MHARYTSTALTARENSALRSSSGSGRWAAGYLVLSAIALVFAGRPALAVLHLALLAALAWSRSARSATAQILWDFAPLAIVIALAYGEVPALIAGFSVSFHDLSIQRVELAVFGAQPAHAFAAAVPNVVVSEILHAGYLSFYLALSLPPVLLYVQRRRTAFDQTVLTLVATWVICCALFVVFPVQGPRFLWSAPPGIPNGPFRWLSATLLAAGSARGTAFPSLHMAASLSQTIMAWRWQSKNIKYAMSVSTVLIATGAVYAGYHYATDMVAGALLGLATTGAVIWVQAGANHARADG